MTLGKKTTRKSAARHFDAGEHLTRLSTDLRGLELLLRMQRQLLHDMQKTTSRLARHTRTSTRTK